MNIFDFFSYAKNFFSEKFRNENEKQKQKIYDERKAEKSNPRASVITKAKTKFSSQKFFWEKKICFEKKFFVGLKISKLLKIQTKSSDKNV